MPSLKILQTIKQLLSSKDEADIEIAAELYWNDCSLKMKKKIIDHFLDNSDITLSEVDKNYERIIEYATGSRKHEIFFEDKITDKVIKTIKFLINKQTQL